MAVTFELLMRFTRSWRQTLSTSVPHSNATSRDLLRRRPHVLCAIKVTRVNGESKHSQNLVFLRISQGIEIFKIIIDFYYLTLIVRLQINVNFKRGRAFTEFQKA